MKRFDNKEAAIKKANQRIVEMVFVTLAVIVIAVPLIVVTEPIIGVDGVLALTNSVVFMYILPISITTLAIGVYVLVKRIGSAQFLPYLALTALTAYGVTMGILYAITYLTLLANS